MNKLPNGYAEVTINGIYRGRFDGVDAWSIVGNTVVLYILIFPDLYLDIYTIKP